MYNNNISNNLNLFLIFIKYMHTFINNIFDLYIIDLILFEGYLYNLTYI